MKYHLYVKHTNEIIKSTAQQVVFGEGGGAGRVPAHAQGARIPTEQLIKTPSPSASLDVGQQLGAS
jgi:hypothetical protein